MQRLLLIFLLLLTSMMTACHHVMPQEQYTYLAPHSARDKRCIGKCLFARKNCLQICELKNSRYCDCTNSFNTCYIACGGQVLQKEKK